MSEKLEIDLKKLNEEEIKKYFEDSKIDFTPNEKISEKQFNENIPNLLKPNININSNLNSNLSEEKYIQNVSDPYTHLLNLKSQLLQNKSNMDKIITNYNDINSKINLDDVDNYSLLFSNCQKYKSKIDSLLNYDIIKKNQNKEESESDSDSEESSDGEDKKSKKKQENKIKKENKKNEIIKKREENEKLLKQIEENKETIFRKNTEINSLNEKNLALKNNLISKLSALNEEMNIFLKLKIEGSMPNPQLKIKQKILEVESHINKIESIIGNYDFTKIRDTIFGSLKHYMKLSNETNRSWVQNRFENTRILENKLGNFNSQPDNKKLLNNYKQMCDGYMIFLTMEKFKDVISYLKKRLVAIKSIIINSEQFEYDINKLNELIKDNKMKYENLKSKYLQTLESFDKLDKVLKEINNLDSLVKKKI